MRPVNKNPNEFKLQNEMRGFDKDLTINQSPASINLVTVALSLVKHASADELIRAVSSPDKMIDLAIAKNEHCDISVAIAKDRRMSYEVSLLIDDYVDSELKFGLMRDNAYRSAFRMMFKRAGEILIQDVFYLADEFEKINFNIFETDEELPF